MVDKRAYGLQWCTCAIIFLLINECKVSGLSTPKHSISRSSLQRRGLWSRSALSGMTGDSMDPLDPLEGSPETKRDARVMKRKDVPAKANDANTIRKASSKISDGAPVKGAKEVSKKGPAKGTAGFGADGLTLDQQILLSQAEILRTLPLDFFLSFRNICEQLVPRFGVYTLTFHVILLIPIIRIVKFQLNASIYPFLYIGPVLFLVPYLFFWLWENDIIEVPIFDARLLRYVLKQKEAATKTLTKERKKLMKLAEKSGDQETIKKIANLTLMSTIDTENFMSEIISIKKRIKGQAERNPVLSTFAQDSSIESEKTVNFNDDVNSAVKTLIETSLLGKDNESEKSLLEKLKLFQKDLDKSA